MASFKQARQEHREEVLAEGGQLPEILKRIKKVSPSGQKVLVGVNTSQMHPLKLANSTDCARR